MEPRVPPCGMLNVYPKAWLLPSISACSRGPGHALALQPGDDGAKAGLPPWSGEGYKAKSSGPTLSGFLVDPGKFVKGELGTILVLCDQSLSIESTLDTALPSF